MVRAKQFITPYDTNTYGTKSGWAKPSNIQIYLMIKLLITKKILIFQGQVILLINCNSN